MKNILFISLIASGMILSGCKSMNKTQMGTGGGAAAGALVGGLVAKNSAVGAIVGAAVGGTAGYFIGKSMDKQAEELKQAIPTAEVTRVGEGINLTFDSGLLFATGKSDLSAEAKSNLDAFAEVVNKEDYNDTHLLVEGHTDSSGSDEVNMKVSQQRAESVASYLKGQGVDPARLITKWYGESQPKYDNDTPENMAKNRRVEIAIYANEDMKAAAAEQSN